ncbi:MAG: fumarate hydratase [Actinomycetota bacterium]|jgi:fumarate hydratase subunit alpha|nr:fumarate hydratase [Actinomycetota bacterium]
MKSIKITTITEEVRKLLIKANFNLPEDVTEAIRNAAREEKSCRAREILELILENAEIASKQKLPLCQDCGLVYIDLDIGRDICIEESGNLSDLLNQTVAETYNNNYLRKSVVSDPLYERKNTSGNIPAIIHTGFTQDSYLHLKVCLKGGGSENCSFLYMLEPSASEDDIIALILDEVKKNVTKSCPPVIIGVGIGGSSSEVTRLARIASFRNLEVRNSDNRYKRLEEKILNEVNKTGIGPQGLGGRTTALACNIEHAPCHIASLPLAVFFGCHSTRRADSKISPP